MLKKILAFFDYLVAGFLRALRAPTYDEPTINLPVGTTLDPEVLEGSQTYYVIYDPSRDELITTRNPQIYQPKYYENLGLL